MNTYNDIYLSARKTLRLAGVEASDLEARLIVTAASGKTKEEFMRDRHLYVADKSFESAVGNMLSRCTAGEPIAYILGEWEFYGLPIKVSRDVLIPRVDTEVLVDAVVKLFKEQLNGTRVLDMCAGSGCVGLAIASNVPFCRVVLADNSPAALSICRANTLKNSLTRRVSSIELNALEAPPMLLGLFDLIVCNPPYIPTEEIGTLSVSVKEFEPVAALDGGLDGLKFYRSMAAGWKAILKPGGRMAFECGMGQAPLVSDIMTDNGFTDIKTFKDTLDIERVVVGTKQK